MRLPTLPEKSPLLLDENPFLGRLDEVSLYSRALSAGEVRAIYNAGSADKGFNFSGFFSPVDPTPVLNQVKPGATVPVKFTVGGNAGTAIFASGYPKVSAVACAAGAAINAVEEVATASTSKLTFDPATNQYNYLWKTDSNWTGCRSLDLKFVDGQMYSANFIFTR